MQAWLYGVPTSSRSDGDTGGGAAESVSLTRYACTLLFATAPCPPLYLLYISRAFFIFFFRIGGRRQHTCAIQSCFRARIRSSFTELYDQPSCVDADCVSVATISHRACFSNFGRGTQRVIHIVVDIALSCFQTAPTQLQPLTPARCPNTSPNHTSESSAQRRAHAV